MSGSADDGPGRPADDPASPAAHDAGSTAPDGEPRRDAPALLGRPPVPFTQQLGRVVLVLLVALFGVFASYNAQRVDFSWVVGSTEVVTNAAGVSTGGVPLILLLGVTLLLGMAIGALLEWQFLRGRRARKQASHKR